MARLPNENEVDAAMAMEYFTSAEARDSLVRESRSTDAAGISFSDLKRAIRTATPLAASGGGNVIPFRAVQLYRTMLTRSTPHVSQMARAARSGGDLRRMVGDFEMNVIEDDDAVFITISPINDVVPASLTLLNDDGRTVTLELPDPINATQQLGLPAGVAQTTFVLELLQDTDTSVFIT